MTPEIRVHPTEGWIAIHDRPGTPRPWAKVIPGISLTNQDVTGWITYAPDMPPCELCGGTGERINRLEGYPEPCTCIPCLAWCECNHGAAIHPGQGACIDRDCSCSQFIDGDTDD